MKLSIVSGLNESKNSPDAVLKTFSSTCELLKSLNYDGIELSLLEPERIDAKQLNEVMDSQDMEVPALGTGSTFIRFGYSLGHQEEGMRKRAVMRIEKYAQLASEINSKVIIGLIRGRYEFKNNPKREKMNIIDSLRQCCQIAENIGVDLLFEPINRFEIDSYHTIAESLELIKQLKSERIKLLIDTFHIHLEEDLGFIWDDLRELAKSDAVAHIHLADCTRRAPGTGHFDFKEFLNIFKNSGYSGYASVETIMKPSFEDVAKQSSDHVHLILDDE